MVLKLKEKSSFTKKSPLELYVQDGELVQKFDQPKNPWDHIDSSTLGDLLVNWITKKPPINLEELESLFKLKNKEAIKVFIQTKTFLIDVLKNCYHRIRNYFGNNVEMELELLHDPMDNEEKLVLYILTNMNPKDAIKTLIKFNKEWWIKNSVSVRNYLSIDVESQCLTGPNI